MYNVTKRPAILLISITLTSVMSGGILMPQKQLKFALNRVRKVNRVNFAIFISICEQLVCSPQDVSSGHSDGAAVPTVACAQTCPADREEAPVLAGWIQPGPRPSGRAPCYY